MRTRSEMTSSLIVLLSGIAGRRRGVGVAGRGSCPMGVGGASRYMRGRETREEETEVGLERPRRRGII